jgi:hypothetical protein
LKAATSSKKGSQLAPSKSSSGALFGSSGQGTGFVPQGSGAASVKAAREEVKGSPWVLPSTSFLSSLPLPPQSLPYAPSQSSVAATVRAARQNVASSSGTFFGLPSPVAAASSGLRGSKIVVNPFGSPYTSSRPQTSAIQPLSVIGSSAFGSSSASLPPSTSGRLVLPSIKRGGGSRTHHRKKRNPNHKTRKPKHHRKTRKHKRKN